MAILTGNYGLWIQLLYGFISLLPERQKEGTEQKQEESAYHALGRNRGKFSTKIHLIADRTHNPLAVALSSGAAHDSAYFEEVVKKVSFKQTKGRPRNKPDEITADKGYDAGKIQKELRRRGFWAMIPEKALDLEQKAGKKHLILALINRSTKGEIEQAIVWLEECRHLEDMRKLLPALWQSFSWQL